MTRRSPLHQLKFLPVIFVFFLFTSCSSSSGIDDYFTFNVEKSLTFDLSEDTGTVSQLYIRILADSADFAANGTTSALIKSVKLTRFVLTSNLSAFPPSSVIDSLSINAVDSLDGTAHTLAFYFGANDSTYLTHADFASFFNSGISRLNANYHNPPQGFSYTVNYTLVFTARPLP